MTILDNLKRDNEAPEWMGEEGYKILSTSYLLPEETPLGMYKRIANAAVNQYKSDTERREWATRFFDVMWKNWLCPASPILSNMGTTRGLPISCNSLAVDDSVDSIFDKAHELAMLTKHGAGVGIYMGNVRGRGSNITGNGKSEGLIPWLKVFDSTIVSVSQGGVRKGASAIYLPVEHSDSDEFLLIRRPTGDQNRRCLNLNHAFTITNKWMEEMVAGDAKKRLMWQEILKTRVETGEPYLMFVDNVNNANPECYKEKGLNVQTSNICCEVVEFTDPEHTFVCCLSSLNLSRWDEWKATNLSYIATHFLDGVMQEYIEKSEGVSGLERSRRSAIKGRALGLGVLGWHSLLQSKRHAFDSFPAMMLNAQVFKTIRSGADKATSELADMFGEPEWCRGFNTRNTHLLAVAPTVSNSAISGGMSAGIEPLAANAFSVKSATGTFFRRNIEVEKILEERSANTPDVWKSVIENGGSIQHLEVLTEDEKKVFLTAREINQHAIVKQAVQRQKYVDQAQSVNLFFAQNSSPRYIHEVHLNAWRDGLKTLYYLRTEGVLKGDLASRSSTECAACEA